MDPLANLQTVDRGHGDRGDDHADNCERGRVALRQPDRAGADQVCQFSGSRIQNSDGDRHSVKPKVPCSEKTAEISEGAMRPNVQAAFERHNVVEQNHHRRHRKIKDEHGRNPGQRLRPSEHCRHPHPGATHNAEHLR